MPKPVIIERWIAATPSRVFETLSDPRRYASIQPAITAVEVLASDAEGRVERFRETRLMRGREATCVLEIKERRVNERLRFESDAGGAIWDSVYTLRPERDGTQLTFRMEARPYKFFAKLLTPLIHGMVTRAVTSDFDEVVKHFEQQRK